ncbi:MAG: hypothetical protein HY922_04875 [Elusimicrobia bacterium]|nr:hypothetical protein [Elusimicrobiota bacterium]
MSEAVNRAQLLANVARFCREALRRDRSGRELAASVGLHDDQVLERFQVGYANGSLLRAIPSKGGVRDALRELGLLGAEGKESALGCLLVPAYDQQENVLGFVAVGKDGKEARFPASLPLYRMNWKAFTEKAVIFTDSALKVLQLAQAGRMNAVPLAAELCEEEQAFIERHRPDRAYFWAELPEALRHLQKLEVPCYRLALQLPTTPEQVAQALDRAEPIGDKIAPDAVVRVLEDVLRFECGARKYEVKELAPNEADRLRVRICAQGEALFHLDTLDLYAGRSRASFARAAAPLFGVSESAVDGDLCLMIRKLEAIRAARKAELQSSTGYAMTPDEEAEALELLKGPDLLARVVKDLEAMGYVGEEPSKRIGYLITVSRKLESPLCGVVISRAGAGKSRLLEVLAELVPPEDLVSYTRITPQALYYAENKSFKNKLMVSGEDEGLLGSDYAMRELISAKKIRLAAPIKDAMSGKMKTVEYEVEGPIALLFSTTRPAIHYENATRCFTLSLDESADQTQQIHQAQRLGRTFAKVEREQAADDLRRLHRNAQRLLKPLLVVNPFAMELSFPTHPLEMRREHEKYLSLIEALALLHQHQRPRRRCMFKGREVEYVEVAVEDLEEANRLMTEVLGTRAEELSRPSRELLRLVRQMVEEKSRELEMEPRAYRFNRRDIREYTGWSDNQIKAHIGQLEELEYLLVGPGERGRMYRYELAYEGSEKDQKRLPGLTDTDKLRSKVGKLGMVGRVTGKRILLENPAQARPKVGKLAGFRKRHIPPNRSR